MEKPSNNAEWHMISEHTRYDISNDGYVRNRYTGRILRGARDRDGYRTVMLYNDGKKYTKKIHRLVAQYFLEPDPERDQVNHKDGNKTNNHVSNLEWCTRSENTRHAYEHKLFEANMRPAIEAHTKIKRDRYPEIWVMRKQGTTLKNIAEMYGVGISTIHAICKEGGV